MNLIEKLMGLTAEADKVPVEMVRDIVDAKTPTQCHLDKLSTATLERLWEREEFGTKMWFDLEFTLMCKRLEERK